MSRRLIALIVFAPWAMTAPLPLRAADRYASSCDGISYEQPRSADCDAEMAASPFPNVQPLAVDDLSTITYMQVANRTYTPVYDAPAGRYLHIMDPGYIFFSVDSVEGDWAQINPGRWLRAGRLIPVRPSAFTGVLIPEPLPRPMAWVLLDTYFSPTPGAAPQSEQFIRRYTRLNIFATVRAGDWNWYLIGPGQWIEQRRVARVLPIARPPGVSGRWVAVDLYEQVAVAYEDDRMVFATLVASGLRRWPTEEGLFTIWSRFTSTRMRGSWGQEDFYYLENVPWTMYFNGNQGLHGTYWHDAFGYRHSHGCVNLSITDARWLFNWTAETNPEAWVYVWSSGEYR